MLRFSDLHDPQTADALAMQRLAFEQRDSGDLEGFDALMALSRDLADMTTEEYAAFLVGE